VAAAALIFRRAALQEFANIAGAVFVALLAILITTVLIRLLGQAAGGRIASEAVLALLGLSALSYLPIVLSLTMFVAILLTMSRAYRDSEMIIWFSSGLPLTAWVRPVLIFALPLVALITLLVLFLTPWSVAKSTDYQQAVAEREELSQIRAGTFHESRGRERVFFVEGIAEDASTVQNIFVSSVQHGRLGVMVSRGGYQETMPNGDRFAVMLDGRRYEGVPGTPEYRVMDFERYAIRIDTKEGKKATGTPKGAPLSALLDDPSPANLAQLLWRVSIPVSALTLALLAIPLSFVNPRAGRATNLALAILIFLVYSNLINVAQAWVQQGRLGFAAALAVTHLVMVVVLLSLFYRRIATNSPLRLRR
jgi:lipopolysaccharide export system permease protein